MYILYCYIVYTVLLLYVLTQSERQGKGKALHLKTAIIDIERMSCLRWDLILWHTARQADALPTELRYMYTYIVDTVD